MRGDADHCDDVQFGNQNTVKIFQLLQKVVLSHGEHYFIEATRDEIQMQNLN